MDTYVRICSSERTLPLIVYWMFSYLQKLLISKITKSLKWKEQGSDWFIEINTYINYFIQLSEKKAMATHSSTLAWKIPWTEEPGRLQSMRLLRVGHDWSDLACMHESENFSLSCIGEGNGNPLQCSCLEHPRDGGAWWAAVSGVAQSRTRLKWLSSSSNKDLKLIIL